MSGSTEAAAPAIHPRYVHYPVYTTYDKMPNEFRPFAMFTHQPNFESECVNTDKLGMRRQYDAAGELLEWETLRQRYRSCNVVVGNSTMFGVGASTDAHTTPAHLQRDGVPCLNISIRGGTSQQELVLFQLLKRYLPPIENIVIISGIINISLAAIKETLFYPEFGSIFSEKDHFRSFVNQYERFNNWKDERVKVLYREKIDRWYADDPRFKSILDRTFGETASRVGLMPSYTFEQKLAIMNDVLNNDIEMWGCIQAGLGCKVHFVMQPVIGWTSKKLTAIEASMYDIDFAREASYAVYANAPAHAAYSTAVAAMCKRAEIDFHDANAWTDDPRHAEVEIFTDICHMSDSGYELLARLLREKLAWHRFAGSPRRWRTVTFPWQKPRPWWRFWM